MSEDANVEGLRNSLTIAIKEVGGIQSALEAARTRCDGVLAIINRVSDGAEGGAKEEADKARAAVQVASDHAQDGINATLLAIEPLASWSARL